MKTKIFSVLLAALLWGVAAIGQASYFGFKGGVNLATFNNDYVLSDNLNKEVKEGISAGLFAEFPVVGGLTFQPELNYIEKGTTFTGSNGITSSHDLIWRYVEMPLMLKYRFTTDKGNIYFTGGPFAGYAVSGVSKYDHWKLSGSSENAGSDEIVTDDVDYEFRSDFDANGQKDNRLDLGIGAGMGVEFNIGPGNFIVDARYGWDLTDNLLFEADKPDNYEGTFHRDAVISVGYAFPLQ